MNFNQNHKITQITSETLIVGVDIAKHNHVARAQLEDWNWGKRVSLKIRKQDFIRF